MSDDLGFGKDLPVMSSDYGHWTRGGGRADAAGMTAIATVAVRSEDLTKFYGHRRGLEGLDLEVRSGEVFGYLGPNGAGKATTIRLLLDLHAGRRVRVDGPWSTARLGPRADRGSAGRQGDIAFR